MHWSIYNILKEHLVRGGGGALQIWKFHDSYVLMEKKQIQDSQIKTWKDPYLKCDHDPIFCI